MKKRVMAMFLVGIICFSMCLVAYAAYKAYSKHSENGYVMYYSLNDTNTIIKPIAKVETIEKSNTASIAYASVYGYDRDGDVVRSKNAEKSIEVYMTMSSRSCKKLKSYHVLKGENSRPVIARKSLQVD